MKKIIKVIFMGLFLVMTFSCQNVNTSLQEKDDKAYLYIALTNNERTVLPQILTFENDLEISFELKGSLEGKDLQTLKKWTASDSKTSYTLMTEDSSVLINAGFWKFELTAQKNEQIVFTGSLEKEIKAGKNILDFGTLKKVTSGKGKVYIELSFAQDGKVQVVQGGLYNLDGTVLEGFEQENLTISTNEKNAVLYEKEFVPCGTYLVKIELFSDKEATDVMNVYTEIVQVATGFVSEAQRTIEQLNTLYTITYDLNGGNFVEGFTAPASFNKYMTIGLPAAEKLKTTKYTFLGWKNAQGDIVTDIPSGTTGDITLTAEWAEGIICTADNVAEIIRELEFSDEPYTIIVTGEINDDTIWAIRTALQDNSSVKVNLDLENTTGLTSIRNGCFRECNSLISVVIPEGVTEICARAFALCSSLESVIIPKSVTTLETEVFRDCSSLESVIIPKSVTTLEHGVFRGCSSLISVVIPEGVTEIGCLAFALCSSLESVIIPEGVTTIEEDLFYYCSSLTSVEIPEGVTEIGSYAFGLCSSLESVIIPEGVTTIEEDLFYYCSSLTSVEIPEGVTEIGSYAFGLCSSLESVIIPEGVTTIEEDLFYDCRSLTNVEIPNSVTTIGDRAFLYCSSLTCVEIPKGVTEIGEGVFSGCGSLESVIIPEGVTTIEEDLFYDCRSLTNVEIPNSVTTIGDRAFLYCSSLTCVEIPKGVTEIGECVFVFCGNLQNITFTDTDTWYYTSNDDYTNGTQIDVTNPSNNATYLKGTYNGKYWYKE